MVKIAEAGNTENPALLVIQKKGYRLSMRYYECTIHQEKGCADCNIQAGRQYTDIVATKDGNTFMAEGGPALLGLITLWENRGADWQTQEGEEFLLGKLPEDA